jgi:hypothetical protein
MKFFSNLLIIAFAAIATQSECNHAPAGKMNLGGKTKTSPVLVELFTSEGCSSCPPADRLLPKLGELDSNVITVSYHVDYWDRLGWKDQFSNPSYSERQRQYGDHFKLDGVYTPELVINGIKECVGSDRVKANQFIDDALDSQPNATFPGLNASLTTENIRLQSQVQGEVKDKIVVILLVQAAAKTQVKAGENEGVTIEHTNIVRLMKTIPAAATIDEQIPIPVWLMNKEFSIVIFIQDKKTLRVEGAEKLKI